MKLIQSFGTDAYQYPGEYPAPCVVEGDDGFRILIHPTPDIPKFIADAAKTLGVEMTIIEEPHEAHTHKGTFPIEGHPSYSEVADRYHTEADEPTFVHIHTHSEFSSLDGFSTIPEIVACAVADNQPAVAVTDHGTCAAHPHLQAECDDAGIKPIFGLEAYFVDDRHRRPLERTKPKKENTEEEEAVFKADQAAVKDYWHLVLIAMNDTGLRNLWAMSTEASRDGFYYHPRLDWDTLERYSEGIICTTACLRGPVSRAILQDDMPMARIRMSRLQDIFGDRLYAEVHTNHLEDQFKVNAGIVKLADEMNVPCIAVVDSHYSCCEHKDAHHVWIAAQTSSNINEEAGLFDSDENYHLMTRDEVMQALLFSNDLECEEWVENTVKLADRCTARLAGDPSPPKFGATHDADFETLFAMCEMSWQQKCQGNARPEQEYADRFEREMKLLVAKNLCGYFDIVADYCLDPATPVLTEDLRWVAVGDLKVHDRLAGFDDGLVVKKEKGHRYWRSASVVNTKRIMLPTYRVTLEDGTVTIASEDHQWLMSAPSIGHTRWVKTKDLRVGQRSHHLVDEWRSPDSWEAGYLAGIFDGEGCLNTAKNQTQGHEGRSWSLTFAQKEGVVLDTALRILDDWGFDYSNSHHGPKRDVRIIKILGGRPEMIRLLGMARPQRLLAKLDFNLLGRIIAKDRPAIVSVEPLGMGEVVALETTTGTLVAQGFAHHNCLWAKRQGILVGPGRGSGGASLVAYLSGITEIDPVDAELPFERFLTPGRTELPDFDIDFPPSRIDEVIQYVTDKWGERCVVRVGSHIRLKSKGVLKNLAMTLRGKHDIDFGDLEAIGKIIDAAEKNTAGLGLSWEELWNQNEDDLRPWAVKYPEIFAYAETMVGRLKSYGKHAAGFIISSDVDLTDTLPLRKAGEQLVAEFDMRALAEIGLVKFDFLSVRNLDTLQQCVDLIRERTGEEIDLYSWKDEYDDQDVWDFISAGNTLGCFQIETNAGTMMTKAVQPRNLHDMADVTTLDRPGPMRSKLDVQYLDRRHGRAPVSYADPRLEKVLHRTFGVMLYQEDIMGICRELAGYDEEEADYVRKILGKKKVAEAEKEGRKFIPACVERGLSQAAAEAIWSQMFEFSRYSFNKAHAYAYGMISYWCAWFSYHYPTEFFVAAMSTVDSDRIPAFVIGAENRGCQVLPPDINDSGRGFAAKGNVIRFGLDAIKGVGEAGVKWLLDHQPYTTFEEFMDAKPNMAVAKPVVRAGAFDSIVPNRKQLEGIIVQYETEEINRCVHWNPDKVGAPNGLPCEFRWDLRVPEIGKKGRPLKLPDISKKCTVVCKHYEKRTSLSTIEVEPYSDGEIQEIETELFGIYLTSSPFESIPEDIREQLWTARDLDANVVGSKGIAAAIVKEVTQTKDRNQKSMAFVSLFFGDGDEKAVCFQKQWGTYKRYLRPNQLVFVQLEKTTRGFTILDVQPATGVK